jgi:hypothetical protein
MLPRRQSAHGNRHLDVVCTARSKHGAAHNVARAISNLRSDIRWRRTPTPGQQCRQHGHTSQTSSAHTHSDSFGVPDCFTLNTFNLKENSQ